MVHFLSTDNTVIGHVSFRNLQMFTDHYNFAANDEWHTLRIPVGDISKATLDFIVRWIEGRELDGSVPPTISFFRDLCHTSFFLGLDRVLSLSLSMLWFLMENAAISESDKPLEKVWRDSIIGSPVLNLYACWYVKCYLIDRRDFPKACKTTLHPIAGTWTKDIRGLIQNCIKSRSYKEVLVPNLGKIQEAAKKWTRSPPKLTPANEIDWNRPILPPMQTLAEQIREENLRRLEKEEEEEEDDDDEDDDEEGEEREVHWCSADHGREVRKEIFQK